MEKFFCFNFFWKISHRMILNSSTEINFCTSNQNKVIKRKKSHHKKDQASIKRHSVNTTVWESGHDCLVAPQRNSWKRGNAGKAHGSVYLTWSWIPGHWLGNLSLEVFTLKCFVLAYRRSKAKPQTLPFQQQLKGLDFVVCLPVHPEGEPVPLVFP